MKQLIAVDADALAQVLDRLETIEQMLETVNLSKAPKMLTVEDYAARVGRSRQTILRQINDGKIAGVVTKNGTRWIPNPDV